MKWVHMGNNKSFVDCELLYHLLRVYLYGVDRAYSAIIEVEHQLLINNILLMDGVFRCRTQLMGSPI